MNNYTGIYPIAPTPFDDNGALDLDGQRRVLDCMIDQGVDGICILANFSEQFLLSDAERDTLMELCLKHAAGRVMMIATCSHFSTQIAVERVKKAEDLGAKMVMMMPPYHGALLRPDEEGIYEHFEALSNAIDIPIMIQDAPLSGVQMSVPLLARIARELDNVSYFKIEVPGTADKIRTLVAAAGSHIDGPFDGEEAITLMADLDAGATGTMTSALMPELIRPIVHDYLAGYREAAKDRYEKVLPLINYENRQCGLRACKTVMAEGGVIKSDRVRHPLRPLSTETRKGLLELAADLEVMALSWGK